MLVEKAAAEAWCRQLFKVHQANLRTASPQIGACYGYSGNVHILKYAKLHYCISWFFLRIINMRHAPSLIQSVSFGRGFLPRPVKRDLDSLFYRNALYSCIVRLRWIGFTLRGYDMNMKPAIAPRHCEPTAAATLAPLPMPACRTHETLPRCCPRFCIETALQIPMQSLSQLTLIKKHVHYCYFNLRHTKAARHNLSTNILMRHLSCILHVYLNHSCFAATCFYGILSYGTFAANAWM